MKTELQRTTPGSSSLIIYCLIITDPNKLLLHSPSDSAVCKSVCVCVCVCVSHVVWLVYLASRITDGVCVCRWILEIRREDFGTTLSLVELNACFHWHFHEIFNFISASASKYQSHWYSDDSKISQNQSQKTNTYCLLISHLLRTLHEKLNSQNCCHSNLLKYLKFKVR